jgi:hypothetical protein
MPHVIYRNHRLDELFPKLKTVLSLNDPFESYCKKKRFFLSFLKKTIFADFLDFFSITIERILLISQNLTQIYSFGRSLIVNKNFYD